MEGREGLNTAFIMLPIDIVAPGRFLNSCSGKTVCCSIAAVGPGERGWTMDTGEQGKTAGERDCSASKAAAAQDIQKQLRTPSSSSGHSKAAGEDTQRQLGCSRTGLEELL